jgi:hypothetical protein
LLPSEWCSITMRKQDLESLKDLLRHFDPMELVTIFSALCAYPPNRKFQLRFEILISLVCSMHPSDFKGNGISKKGIKKILEGLSKAFEERFAALEDSTPPINLETIPYYLKGRRYYFFYGLLERPYESLEHFEMNYSCLNEILHRHLGCSAEDCLVFLLQFQTEILRKLKEFFMTRQDQPSLDVDRVLFPPHDFVEFWQKLVMKTRKELLDIIPEEYMVGCKHFIDESSIHLGDLKFNSIDSYLNMSPTVDFIFLDADTHLIIPLPQTHLEFLYGFFYRKVQNLISEKKSLNEKITENLLVKTLVPLQALFGKKNIITHVKFSDKNNDVSEAIDIAILFDFNKLILINIATEAVQQNDLSSEIKKAYERLLSAENFFYQRKRVSLCRPEGWVANFPETSRTEIVKIVVFNNLELSPGIITLPVLFEKDVTWIVAHSDFRVILEEIGDPVALIKYIRNLNELRKESKVLAMDAIDLFAWYKENNESFSHGGIIPYMFIAAPHTWSEKYHKILLERAKQRRFIFEPNEPANIWKSTKYYENVYLVYHKYDFRTAAHVVNLDDEDLWVMFSSSDFDFTDEEIRIADFLAHCLAYHLGRLKEPIMNLLRGLGFDFSQHLRILIKPGNLISRDNRQAFLKPLIRNLSSSNPLVSLSNIIKDSGNIAVTLIFDQEGITREFSKPENRGERLVLRRFVGEVMKFFRPLKPQDLIKQQADNFIDKHLKLGQKSFSLDSIRSPNNQVGIARPIKNLNADFSKISGYVARFLKREKIKPGLYTSKEAAKINNKIFSFLQSVLEAELRKYDFKEILFFAYFQLENIESFRTLEKLRLAMNLQLKTDYDPVEKIASLEKEMSSLALAVRHVIETITKNKPEGKSVISIEDWTFIQAIATVLIEICFISDNIYFEVIPFGLRINDDYSFADEKLQNEIDIEGFRYSIGKSMATFYRGAIEELRAEISKPTSEFPKNLEDVDEGFEDEYGYSFQEYGKVARFIANFPVNKSENAPLTYIEETNLVEYIGNISEVEKSRIETILENMSLSHLLLTKEIIEPWRFKSRPNRLIVKPLIKITQGLGKKYYLFGNWEADISSRIWINQIVEGRLPISIENLRSQKLKDALQNQRQRVSKQFELKVLEIVKRLVTFAERVSDYAKFFGSKKPCPGPGEIDALAIDRRRKKVFVFEAKDIVMGLTPRDIKNEMQRFFKPSEGYVYKLFEKFDFVKDNLKQILQYYKMEETEAWEVKKAFVTSCVHISAFSEKASIDFLGLDDLRDFVNSA